MPSPYSIQSKGPYRFIRAGRPSDDTPTILLLHGMLGDLGNWTAAIRYLSEQGYDVVAPLLPVYDLPLNQTSVSGLTSYVHGFLCATGIENAVFAGNSLGGHIALLYTLTHQEKVAALILSGASGIYEVSMGTSTPRRHDREFIRERAAVTFYDPVHASDELVDEMLELVNDRSRVVRLIKMARSTKSETVADRLGEIERPTLLVWGRDDAITPPDVAQRFNEGIPRSELVFIDRCGHAPMIEHPAAFNKYVGAFLARLYKPSTVPSHDKQIASL